MRPVRLTSAQRLMQLSRRTNQQPVELALFSTQPLPRRLEVAPLLPNSPHSLKIKVEAANALVLSEAPGRLRVGPIFLSKSALLFLPPLPSWHAVNLFDAVHNRGCDLCYVGCSYAQAQHYGKRHHEKLHVSYWIARVGLPIRLGMLAKAFALGMVLLR